VAAVDGATTIGAVDSSGLEALKSHLYTAGELLRMNQLQPDPASLSQSSDRTISSKLSNESLGHNCRGPEWVEACLC